MDLVAAAFQAEGLTSLSLGMKELLATDSLGTMGKSRGANDDMAGLMTNRSAVSRPCQRFPTAMLWGPALWRDLDITSLRFVP